MIRALFGGSFDPFHRGHLAIIETLLARGLAQAVVVVPAGRNPHKPAPDTPGAHRVRMAELGVSGLPAASVLDVEALREGPSYTVDTLETLVRAHPGDAWRLAVGSDNLPGFATWRRPERLLALAELVVFPRGPGPVTVPPELSARTRVVADFAQPVSSTAVRAALAAGQRPLALVPGAVLDYVDAHGLYRPRPGEGGQEGAACR